MAADQLQNDFPPVSLANVITTTIVWCGADLQVRDKAERMVYDIALSRPNSRWHRKIAELLRRHMK